MVQRAVRQRLYSRYVSLHKVAIVVALVLTVTSAGIVASAANSPAAPRAEALASLHTASVSTASHTARTTAKTTPSSPKGGTPAKAVITPVVTTGSANSSAAGAAAVSSGSPLKGLSLYVDPALSAQGRPSEIASRASAKWFGNWSSPQADMNAYATAAAAAGQVPVAVLYNIPSRDCGSYSAGGAGSEAGYDAWIDGLVAGLGGRKAIVVVEPDAIAQADCLSPGATAERYRMLTYAVQQFKLKTGAVVYLDGGNSNWKSVTTIVNGLRLAGIAQADGFSLNVSNFQYNTDTINYGNQISAQIGGKGYVIDTSRNGRGPGSTWCNPAGRGLGRAPSTDTGVAHVDAYLWIKAPGESDGACNGGPDAGVWWPDGAAELVRNAAL